MLREILRFNREGKRWLETGMEAPDLGSLLEAGRYSSEFVAYYNRCRPHQSLNQGIPEPQPEQLTSGKVMAFPVLGGLYHDYRRVA